MNSIVLNNIIHCRGLWFCLDRQRDHFCKCIGIKNLTKMHDAGLLDYGSKVYKSFTINIQQNKYPLVLIQHLGYCCQRMLTRVCNCKSKSPQWFYSITPLSGSLNPAHSFRTNSSQSFYGWKCVDNKKEW